MNRKTKREWAKALTPDVAAAVETARAGLGRLPLPVVILTALAALAACDDEATAGHVLTVTGVDQAELAADADQDDDEQEGADAHA